MYSMVLMAAMATAPQSTEFNGFFRDLFSFRGGCSGCYGSQSNQSNGCNGTHGFLGIRDFFHRGSCHGCCGGSGSSSNSCNGMPAYSCTGMPSYSCNGSMPMASYSCNGSMPMASYSCNGGIINSGDPYGMPIGSPYAVPTPTYYSGPVSYASGCNGGSYPTFPAMPSYPGNPSIGAPPMMGNPMTSPPAGGSNNISPPNVPLAPNQPAQPTINEGRYAPRPAGNPANRATVVVRLPADAKLYAENTPLSLTSAERTFVTPELPQGREFTYSFRVEYVRNGRTISESQRVNVRPGQASKLEFNDLVASHDQNLRPAEITSASANSIANANPTPSTPSPVMAPAPIPVPMSALGAAPAPAKLKITIPTGATLYIDKKKDERSEPVREFTTPPLPQGKEYAYYLTVETQKDGLPERVYQKVTFRAGEVVPVDFTKTGSDARVGSLK